MWDMTSRINKSPPENSGTMKSDKVTKPFSNRSNLISLFFIFCFGFIMWGNDVRKLHRHRCKLIPKTSWSGGNKKHEIYAAVFCGHLFMTYFYRAGGGYGPLAPPGSATGADGMERKELSLFTRIDPSISILINSNLIGHKRSLTFVKNNSTFNWIGFDLSSGGCRISRLSWGP